MRGIMEGEETRMKEGNKAVRKYMKYWSMNRLRSRKEGDVGTRGYASNSRTDIVQRSACARDQMFSNFDYQIVRLLFLN